MSTVAIVGYKCVGRTSFALSFIARITRAKNVCAWVDVSDALRFESSKPLQDGPTVFTGMEHRIECCAPAIQAVSNESYFSAQKAATRMGDKLAQ